MLEWISGTVKAILAKSLKQVVAGHYVRELNIFTALHVMQTRSSDENSVRLSVCLSVRPSVCHTRKL